MQDDQEKHQRFTFVLGIVVAAIIGFALNVYSSVYYEVLLLGTKQMSDYNELPMMIPFLVLIYSFEFLSFLIYDYKNTITLDKPFLKRFFEYHDNVFWVTRVTKGILKVFIFAFKWTFAFLIGLSLYDVSGWQALGVWVAVILSWLLMKRIYQRKYGNGPS